MTRWYSPGLPGLLLLAWGALQLACSDPLQDQAGVQAHERPLLSVPAGVVPTTKVPGRRNIAAPEPASSIEEAASLTNPIKNTRGSRERGRLAYSRYCSHCHGDLGYGRTSVGSSLDPGPPDLVERIRDRSDGQLFGTITFGNAVSPALAGTVAVDDRWQIIHYLRTLPEVRARDPIKGPHWDQGILRRTPPAAN